MHIVITGASSGIGTALARELAKQPGAKLTLVARRRERLEALAQELSASTHVALVDLAEQPTPTEWLDEAVSELGEVDVLVNNAGVQVIGRTASIDCDEGERSIALNLFSPLRLIRSVLPSMVDRGRGHIVNVASIAAIAPTPGMTYYNASKAGFAGASESLRGELLDSGVHVMTVYPGIIAGTEMSDKGFDSYHSSRLLALQPQGSPEKLARLIARGLKKRQARLIYPRLNMIARSLPGPTRWLMDRFTPDVKG